MDFPTGQTGRDGWDPVSAAAVCVCVCSVPGIVSRLLPEQGLSAVVMPSIARLPWAFFFSDFAFRVTLSLPVGVVGDGGMITV